MAWLCTSSCLAHTDTRQEFQCTRISLIRMTATKNNPSHPRRAAKRCLPNSSANKCMTRLWGCSFAREWSSPRATDGYNIPASRMIAKLGTPGEV
eukprot:1834174-Amphidinium_carterae.2